MQHVIATIFAKHLDRSTPSDALAAHCFSKLVEDFVSRGWCWFAFDAVRAVDQGAEYDKRFLMRNLKWLTVAMMPEVQDVSSSPFRAFLYMCHTIYGEDEDVKELFRGDDVRAFMESTGPLEL